MVNLGIKPQTFGGHRFQRVNVQRKTKDGLEYRAGFYTPEVPGLAVVYDKRENHFEKDVGGWCWIIHVATGLSIHPRWITTATVACATLLRCKGIADWCLGTDQLLGPNGENTARIGEAVGEAFKEPVVGIATVALPVGIVEIPELITALRPVKVGVDLTAPGAYTRLTDYNGGKDLALNAALVVKYLTATPKGVAWTQLTPHASGSLVYEVKLVHPSGTATFTVGRMEVAGG